MQISEPRFQSLFPIGLLEINYIRNMISDQKMSQIIVSLKAGIKPQKIADDINVSVTTVKRIRRKIFPTISAYNAGRPRALSDRNVSYMMHLITSGKAISSVDLKHSLKSNNISVSTSTIRRMLKMEGMAAITVKPKPYLSPRHKRLRMQYALRHKDWTIDDWKSVIFSDETKINRFGSDERHYIWKRPSSNMQDREISGTVKFGGGSLMMWGCMTYDGVGYACRIDGGLDGELYRKILDDELMQSIEFYKLDRDKVIYAQDNDPKHTAQLTLEWFQTNQIKLLSCPPQSPDINPIEHLWDYLKCKLNAYENPPIGMNQLWERVELE
jgi:transposase